MNVKKILISTAAVWAAGTVLGMITCGWLFNWIYMLPPMIWKTSGEILVPANLIGSYAMGLIASLIFCSVYAFIYNGIPGAGLRKGLTYGLIVFLVGAFAGIGSMPFYMTINTIVVIYWLIQALLMNLLNGAIVAYIYRG